MKKIYGSLIVFFGLIIGGIPPVSANALSMHNASHVPDLRAKESLAASYAMLEAINNRDIAAFEASLSTSQAPFFTFFWGEQVAGNETLVQWHKEWFEEKTWTISSMDLRHSYESENLACLSFELQYDKSETRKFRILLSTVMVREAGVWKIANAQQTMLEGPTD